MINFRFRRAFLALAFIGVTSLTGCGGGSAGTGGQEFKGLVRTTANEPVTGATVTIEATGANGVTDAQGLYVVESPTVTGDITMSVVDIGTTYRITVAGVPGSASEVEVNIELNRAEQVARPTEIKFTEKGREDSDSDGDSDDNRGSDDDNPDDDHGGISGSDNSSDDHSGDDSSDSSDDGISNDDSEDDSSNSNGGSGDEIADDSNDDNSEDDRSDDAEDSGSGSSGDDESDDH